MEERKINLQKEYDTIISKLWEEYELTRREAEKIAVKIEEPAKAQKRLTSLKQSIKALGSVNVDAIEEYRELMERYTFLKTQHDDLIQAAASLEKIIEELENTFHKGKKYKGIAFTIGMTSVIGTLVYGFLANDKRTVKEAR